MSLRALSIALVACLTARAYADRSVQVVANGAPFAAADLVSALRVRLPTDGAPVAVHVHTTDGDRVTVAVGDTLREVDLHGRTGPEAARLVALEVVDLALDDLAVVPRNDPRAPAYRFAVLGSATAFGGVLAGPTGDLVIGRGTRVAAIDVSGDERVSGALHVTSATVRLSGGLRIDQLELRGGVVFSSLWVSDGVGDQTTMPGVTASARLRFALTHDLRFVAAVGADGYAMRTTYQLGMTSSTTPWVAPWVAAGMELAP